MFTSPFQLVDTGLATDWNQGMPVEKFWTIFEIEPHSRIEVNLSSVNIAAIQSDSIYQEVSTNLPWHLAIQEVHSQRTPGHRFFNAFGSKQLQQMSG